MPKKMTRLLGCFCLAIIMALLGVSPPAQADTSTPGDGYTAPAPYKMDPAGVDQDQVCFQDGEFLHPQYGWGAYKIDDVPQAAGCHSTNGAASVTVTTSYDSGTWTFDYTDAQPGEEAENKYWVDIGDACTAGTAGIKYHKVTANFTNVADTTGRFVHSIYPHTEREDRTAFASADTVYDIADGETVGMPIMEQTEEILGLTPGEWVTTFYRADTGSAGSDGYIVKTVHYTVPKCGGNTGGTSRKARGALRRVGCTAVRANLNAVRYDATPTVRYKVYRHAHGHKPLHRNLAVAAGYRRVVVMKKPPRRAVVFTLKVQRLDGRWRWLDTQRVSRCR